MWEKSTEMVYKNIFCQSSYVMGRTRQMFNGRERFSLSVIIWDEGGQDVQFCHFIVANILTLILGEISHFDVIFLFTPYQIELCTYVSIFFSYSMIKMIYPMSPVQSLLHHVILFQYVQSFHRLQLCLPSPYHAVIIRLPTKQYYLFVYLLEFSKRVSPKLTTDTLSIIHIHTTNGFYNAPYQQITRSEASIRKYRRRDMKNNMEQKQKLQSSTEYVLSPF